MHVRSMEAVQRRAQRRVYVPVVRTQHVVVEVEKYVMVEKEVEKTVEKVVEKVVVVEKEVEKIVERVVENTFSAGEVKETEKISEQILVKIWDVITAGSKEAIEASSCPQKRIHLQSVEQRVLGQITGILQDFKEFIFSVLPQKADVEAPRVQYIDKVPDVLETQRQLVPLAQELQDEGEAAQVNQKKRKRKKKEKAESVRDVPVTPNHAEQMVADANDDSKTIPRENIVDSGDPVAGTRASDIQMQFLWKRLDGLAMRDQGLYERTLQGLSEETRTRLWEFVGRCGGDPALM